MRPSSRKFSRQSGLSLIEVMIGLTVGLITVMAVIQTLSLYENQKSTTVSGADAQESGLLALGSIESDVRNAGSGSADPAIFKCDKIYSWSSGPSGGVVSSSRPIVVTDGGKSGSDTISVTQAGSVLGVVYANVRSNNLATHQVTVSRNYDLDKAVVLMVNPLTNQCVVQEVTKIDPPTGDPKQEDFNIYIEPGTSKFNPDDSKRASLGWPSFTSYDSAWRIYHYGFAGSAQVTKTYSLTASHDLQLVTDVTGAVSATDVVASEVVAMQAQYGISNLSSDREVTAWVDATGAWAAPTIADALRIKAVRIAVVARSSKRDVALVTQPCINASGQKNNGPCAWEQDTATSPAPLIDLSTDPDWQHYRYRVYQTIIPMRNVLWPDYQ